MVEVESIPLRFKVSGNIIRKLGGESISSKNVAILELIKNSYDSKATKVEVNLKNEDVPECAILSIEDNGIGMTMEDLENKWMNIATPNKSKILQKDSKRKIIGEKGLGRLSAESLGKKTLLKTKPVGSTTGYKVMFDWEKYQDENVLCGEIINKCYTFPKTKKDKGTILEISELNHNWGDLEVKKSLLRDIYLLTPPNKLQKDFKVMPTFQKDMKDFKKIRKEFLQKAIFSLKTKLTKKDYIQYEFTTIKGKTKKGTIQLEKPLRCGEATFELFFYYKDVRALKTAMGVNISPTDIKYIKEILKEYQGIKLYRDNFRVKPYGEPGNDWIGLEIEAQNQTMCPRNNTIFGMVHIGRENNPDIIDTTTREGIISNDEFEDLKKFVRTSIVDLFVDLRSEEESHKKKARKTIKVKKVGKTTKSRKRKLKIAEPAEISEEDKFIDIKGDYPQNFYNILEKEINDCYRTGYLNATFLLSRKIIECLIYEILEKKFPTQEELWWNRDIGYPLNLSPLIKNLNDNRRQFRANAKRHIEKFSKVVGKFREEVNKTAHNIYDYVDSKKELKDFKINDLVQLLVKIFNII